jgi:hypothetical protein
LVDAVERPAAKEPSDGNGDVEKGLVVHVYRARALVFC